MSDWEHQVLDFWFGLDPEQWWQPNEELDAEIWRQFSDLWLDQRQNNVAHFLKYARGSLAAVILFDQFPRNMFRGHAEQFGTDHMALDIARRAIFEKRFDEQLEPPERGFLYMPFEHSEDLADQRTSVALFTKFGDDYLLGFAKKHHDIIERFGRFPHRNAILGRAPRPAEIAAGDVVPW